MTKEVVRRARPPLDGARLDIVGVLALLARPREEENLILAEQLLRNALAAVERAHAVVEHLAQQEAIAVDSVFGRRVLIVDDEKALLGTLRRTLRGYDIVTTASPRDALARIASGDRFAFILSDLRMAEMSGDALLHEIACIDEEQAQRFVFMTAGVLTPEAGAALAAADRPTLRKPFGAKAVWRLFAGVRGA